MIIRDCTINDVVEVTKMFYKLEKLHHRMDRSDDLNLYSECWTYVRNLMKSNLYNIRVLEVNSRVLGYYAAKTINLGNRTIRIGKTAYVDCGDNRHKLMMSLLNDLYFGQIYDVCIAHNVYKKNKGIVDIYLDDLGFKILKTFKDYSREKYVVVKYNK